MKNKAVTVLFAVLFLTLTCVSAKKNRKNKQHVPHIDCDIKAGKIINPEFLAKCPPGCEDGKHRVYGTDIYASFSSICSAAIHSGVIDNAGGKIFVRKVAGQSGYKGSFGNGIRSLSLPRWKESFVVAEGKGKKGVTYPSTLEYVEVKIETVQRIIPSPTPSTTPSTTQPPTTTTTPEPTTPEPTTTPRPTTTTIATTTPTTTARTRPPLLRARDTGSSSIHPAYRSVVAASSRQVQAAQGGRSQNQAYRSPSTYAANRQVPKVNTAYSRVQQILAEKSASAQANPNFQRRDWKNPPQRANVQTVQRRPTAPETINVAAPVVPSSHEETKDNTQDFQRRDWQNPNQRGTVQTVQRRPTAPETINVAAPVVPSSQEETRENTQDTRTSESDPVWKVDPVTPEPIVKVGEPRLWKGIPETAVSVREDVNLKPAETVALGGINCKIDLVFLMDGSWSIGKRRFRIQKLFLSQMAEALDVGLSGPLMGIVQYGDEPNTEFSLRSFFNTQDLKGAVEKISQKGGFSNVGKALSYVNKNYFLDTSGNRGGAPNVAVILVDGWPTDKVEEASRLARESGINIFFVTIEGADENERSSVIEPNFVDKAVCRTNGQFSMNVPSWFGLHKIVNPLVKRMCEIDKLVCSKTCLNAADIAFVIDGSSSVGTGNFRTVLQFIANITSEFEISDTDTRIGAVQYTYEQRLEFGFDKYSSKQDVVNAIMRIGYWSGGTSTGAAITYASDQLFSKSKPNKRKIMIVITDGRSYDDVRVPANAAHRNGVIAYAVGIAWAAHDELESIATDPDKDHSFFVDEFDSLYKFVPKIIQNICTEYNSQPRN